MNTNAASPEEPSRELEGYRQQIDHLDNDILGHLKTYLEAGQERTPEQKEARDERRMRMQERIDAFGRRWDVPEAMSLHLRDIARHMMNHREQSAHGALPRPMHVPHAEPDEIEDGIWDLLYRRMELVEKIGKLKKRTGWEIYDESREKQILERIDAFGEKWDIPDALLEHLKDIMGFIVERSKKMQE